MHCMVMAVTTTKNLNKIIIMAAPFFPRLGCIKLKSPVTLKKKQTHGFIRMAGGRNGGRCYFGL